MAIMSLRDLTSLIRDFSRELRANLDASYRFVFPSAIAIPTQFRRIAIIQSRINALAWVLAISTPLWSILDALAFPYALWQSILIARLLAGAAFGSFLLIGRVMFRTNVRNLWIIYLQLVIIFAIPTLFYIFCNRPPEDVPNISPLTDAVTHSYYLMPLLILSCIGLFPLTMTEALAVGMPLLAVYYNFNLSTAMMRLSSDIGMDWVMVMMLVIAVVICMSHLRMLTLLVDHAAYDSLTECLGRRSGEEITRALWFHSVRRKSPFSVAFIDLDNFKLVNDRFGHKAGDSVLAGCAAAIKNCLRKSDFVIRWGGEEFLVIMPDANLENATEVLLRMSQRGFGTCPDGSHQTVSIGIAERLTDNINNESALIQIADKRLYQAKITGRARIVGNRIVAIG